MLKQQKAPEVTASPLPTHLAVADRLISIGTLAAGVAHEMNNPLSYVLANLRVCTEIVAGTEGLSPVQVRELRDALADALEGAQRLRSIAQDLRMLSRNDDGQKALIDVRRCVDTAINMSWNEIRHRARLEKSYSEVPLLEANEGKLVQVFLNLLINAAQAIEPGSVSRNLIRVTILAEGKELVIRISDTGGGIPPDIVEKIFEPFFTTKNKDTGTGLGLAICRDIMEKSGGTLSAENREGVGATFIVRLPIVVARPV